MDMLLLFMATISPGELKRHCRIRGGEELRKMSSGLQESVWELTDTTGLRLVNHDVWEVQQKHLECLQDSAGIKLCAKGEGGHTLERRPRAGRP